METLRKATVSRNVNTTVTNIKRTISQLAQVNRNEQLQTDNQQNLMTSQIINFKA